jgi:hypothetical protein
MFNLIKIIIKYVFNLYNSSNLEINNNTNNFLKYDNNDNNDNILYTELKIFELNVGDREYYESDEDIAKYK